MKQKRASQWAVNKGIAQAILTDRVQRRKVLSWFAFGMLGVFAFGLWGVKDWLNESALRFGLYWAACAGFCLFVMVFALFDAIAVLKEEREKGKRDGD